MPLDPKVRAMLDYMNAMNPPPLHTLSPQVARQGALAQLAQLKAFAKPVAGIVNRTIAGPAGDLSIRVYTPPGEGPFPLLVFFHGGGWVICNLDTHDNICRDLCLGAGAVVVSVDYRLAPENKFPAAADDCLAATRWVAANAASLGGDATRIAVAGDSAGGNLAAVTALRIRDEGGPVLCGQLLVYPMTAYHTPPTRSGIENAEGYFLSRDGVIWFWGLYLKDASQAMNPLAAPLASSDFSRLPSALVITAEYDPLRDEGAEYAQRLKQAGVTATLSNYDGMIHGFFGSFLYEQGAGAMQEACTWLKKVYASK